MTTAYLLNWIRNKQQQIRGKIVLAETYEAEGYK